MADFRRFIPALAVLALLVGLMPTANAQLSCDSKVVPPTVRSEGMTELVGDVVLDCKGGTTSVADAVLPTVNITVYYSQNVTSRLLGGSSSSSEALLLIDEPAPGAQRFVGGTTAVNQTANGSGTEFGAAGSASNIYEGIWSSATPNAITFLGIPVDAPGTTGSRIFRITNVRVNASAAAGNPGQVTAFVAVTPASGSTSSSLTVNNQNPIVAFVTPSLTFSLNTGDDSAALGSSGVSIRQCSGLTAGLTSSTGKPAFRLKYAEKGQFATAFKPQIIGTTQSVPGTIYNSESGFVSTAVPAAGLADYGTRFRAVFTNIPAGVQIWVGLTEQTSGTPGTGISAQLTGSETGAFFAVPATDQSNFGLGTTSNATSAVPAAALPIVNGSAEAVWEVRAAQPSVVDTFEFPVWITTTSSVPSNTPGPGALSVNGSYAPAPPAFTASAGVLASSSLSIPRFVDTSTAMVVGTVSVCRTTILFPFATNQLGFDTGLAIANTTMDPFGTTGQAGTCQLNFYDGSATPPAAVTTASVAAGGTYVGLVSTLSANFQGYIIAVCNFQLGHGFAFVSDMGAQKLAMGYLGLILADPPRQSSGITTAGSGEVLGN